MGYYVRTLPNKKSNPKWKVQFISKKKEHTKTSTAQFPSKTWDIHQDRWSSLGFFKSMTIEEARDIAKGLNAKEKIKRQEEQYKKYQLRVSEEQLRTAAFLPDEFVAEFEHSFLRTRDSETIKKIRKTPRAQIIWRASQKMLRETGLSPSEWFENQRTFYDWLYHKKYSISYAVKILKIANLWGFYFSKKMGRPFLPINMPRGYERQRLADAFYDSTKAKRKASAPLTPEMLGGAKFKLKSEQFNWLYLSVWFGLRPKEVDSLKDPSLRKVELLQTGRQVLWVYRKRYITPTLEYRLFC